MTEEEKKLIAENLRKPKGEMGKLVAEKMNEGNLHVNLNTIERLAPLPGHHIVELGMANGHFVSEILKLQERIRYTGFDYSQDMVELASEANKKWVEQGIVAFHCASADDLPLADASVDIFFSVNTIYFWSDTEKVFNEITRIMKPGGKVIISIRPKRVMMHYPVIKHGFVMYTGEDVEKLMETAGFNQIKVEEMEEPKQPVFDKIDIKYSVIISARMPS